MGIDKHELEHRNWRSKQSIQQDNADAPSIDETSIVPDDDIQDIQLEKKVRRPARTTSE